MRVKTFILFYIFLFSTGSVFSQRQYALNSVLVSGDWYKIAINKEGVYKIDIPFLSGLGINISQINSSTIALYGNGGAMIPEANAEPRKDDLYENAIEVFDGGDGIFNGNDYLIFYAPGPQRWEYNTTEGKFHHKKNLLNDTCFYFLSIRSNGKRIPSNTVLNNPNVIVENYDDRIFYENDSNNILNSGKQWVGEEFTTLKNRITFNHAMQGLIVSQPIKLSTKLIGRSISSSTNYTLTANSQNILNVSINPVTGNLIDNFVESAIASADFYTNSSDLVLNYTYQSTSNTSQGWLDWYELQYRKSLSFINNGHFGFRDTRTIGINNIAQFKVNNANQNTIVWDVSNHLEPRNTNGLYLNNQYVFTNSASELKEYYAFDKTRCPSPISIGKIVNQNYHQVSPIDYVIITPSVFKSDAERLAAFHRTKNQLTVFVAETEKLYNEFGGGNKSAAAIRDFIKMYYDKSISSSSNRLKYILLFGIGNYDTKQRNSNKINHIPCFESDNSVNTILSYTTDDFYGLLSDNDDINQIQNQDSLCVSVGRLPVTNALEAARVVDKIIRYGNSQSLGSWRNELFFVADDRDANLFFNATEELADTLKSNNPVFNVNKLYVDAFPLKREFNAVTSPSVNRFIGDELFSGKLIFNYSGHGNFQQLSAYSILNNDVVRTLNNSDKLPLFITATCDFLPYDDPGKSSIGTYMIQGSKNGAIALMTTPRLMFAGSNELINENILKSIFDKKPSGERYTLGESFLNAKNNTNGNSSDRINHRKFSLIGDPALKLAFPKYTLSIDSINNSPIRNGDTILSGRQYIIKGLVKNNVGALMTDFNGIVQLKIFDKPKAVNTLANDPGSIAATFLQQTDLIYNGRAEVKNGRFLATVFISKDIINPIGKIKMSVYADNGIEDANGFDTSFYIEANQGNILNDNTGPEVKLYLDDYNFKNGGIVGDRPLLLVRLKDSSGVNTVNNGLIDHNIKAVIDGDELNPIILNSFYQTEINTYRAGSIVYQLPIFTKGAHTIKLIAWDNTGNKGTASINFNVLEDNSFHIHNLMNYPNPVNDKTIISFQLMEPYDKLDISVNLYNQEGRLMHVQKSTIASSQRSIEIPIQLDFNKLPSGVYFYRVIISNQKGEVANRSQKLLKL
jgi:hypothetical protein